MTAPSKELLIHAAVGQSRRQIEQAFERRWQMQRRIGRLKRASRQQMKIWSTSGYLWIYVTLEEVHKLQGLRLDRAEWLGDGVAPPEMLDVVLPGCGYSQPPAGEVSR